MLLLRDNVRPGSYNITLTFHLQLRVFFKKYKQRKDTTMEDAVMEMEGE